MPESVSVPVTLDSFWVILLGFGLGLFWTLGHFLCRGRGWWWWRNRRITRTWRTRLFVLKSDLSWTYFLRNLRSTSKTSNLRSLVPHWAEYPLSVDGGISCLKQTEFNGPLGFCLEGQEIVEVIWYNEKAGPKSSNLSAPTGISRFVSTLVVSINMGGLWQVQSRQHLLPAAAPTTGHRRHVRVRRVSHAPRSVTSFQDCTPPPPKPMGSKITPVSLL